MSFIGKAIKSIAGALDRAEQSIGGIPQDLRALDKTQNGLAAAAHAYIMGTGDTAVLSTLKQKRPQALDGGMPSNHSHTPGVAERRVMFFDPTSDPDVIARYVQVLNADKELIKYYSLPASETVPTEVRMYLTELLHCRNRSNATRDPMINDRVLKVVKQLGGTPLDLLDVIFFQDKAYRRTTGRELAHVLDLPDLTMTFKGQFVQLNAHLPLPGRESLFYHISQTKRFDTVPFDQMVIDGLGDTSKAIRERAVALFAKVDPAKRETLATELLAKGNAATRGSAAEILTGIGTDTARHALQSHLETEKTARIRGMIEDFLAVSDTAAEADVDTDDLLKGYQALDGTLVEIPPMRVPQDGPPLEITDDIHATLLKLGAELEADYQRDLAEVAKTGGSTRRNQHYLQYASSISSELFAKTAATYLMTNTYDRAAAKGMYLRIDNSAKTTEVFRSILATLAPKTALDLSLNFIHGALQDVNTYRLRNGPWGAAISDYVDSDEADFRYLDSQCRNIGAMRDFKNMSDREKRPMKPGEQLYYRYMQKRQWYEQIEEGPKDAVIWPLVAENMWIVDRALGIVADPEFPENLTGGLKMLATLPKLPAKYGPALLNIALVGPKADRKLARSLLNRTTGFDGLLINLIDDNRQDVRAGAAKWLGARVAVDAVKPLQKRLKKEKSPVAKAAMVFALQALDQDVSAHIGPAALLAEAEKNLPKANLKDVAWLDMGLLPAVQYRDGTAVPLEVLKWWIALAAKLKAPGEVDLFNLYLDQLKPDDATTLSMWLFDSWYGFDTAPPDEATVQAAAQQQFAVFGSNWNVYFEHLRDGTDAQKLEFLCRRLRAETPNSGSASKGILALTGKMPPVHGVTKVRSYLRKHGGRTSQTTAMLELMAAMGDPMSLQVVIAAATRLRQKGVQKRANELIQIVADRNEWTLDQLADRTVPTGGLEDDGRMELACVNGEKVYVAQLDEKFGLTLHNPDGKVVKALPTGQDDETKEAKKTLSAAKKEIKQAITFQSTRLFEAMCSDRHWTVEDFQRDFLGHPLMRKLVERLIWQGLDADGTALTAFRPTAEGEMIDAADAEADLSTFASLRLAHASTLTTEQAAAWRQHMKDYEIKPLFDQVRANLPRLTEDMAKQTDIEDRKGWLTDCFTIRGEAKKAGYERGSILDSGGFDTYTRHFSGVGIIAVVEFSGSGVPEENWPAAYKSLFFERLPMGQQRGYGSGKKLRLDQLPAVLLAECWADLHTMTAKAAFDPEWEKASPW